MRYGAVACAALAAACGSGSLVAPSITPPRPRAFMGRAVLSGQSNAVNVAPVLSRYGLVDLIGQKSLSIDHWSATDPDVTMWRDLQPHLAGASWFIWWQGESLTTNYDAKLRDLMQRVRSETAAPIVIVRILNRPRYAETRAVQAHVAQQIGAALVDIDACEIDGDSDHLTAAGYECATACITSRLETVK